ncbi:MAG: hypothetical protein HY863_17430 [Chloroflexi bacterium]|nr:hypothetical protein [Chloroflexota bacterium]
MEELMRQVNRYLIGWMGHYRLAGTPSVYKDLDEWISRRPRQLQWKRWKKG